MAAERGVWNALVAGDAAADRAALDPAFLGIYPDGPAGRDGHVGQLADGPTVAAYALTEARVVPLGGDVALLTYRATFARPGAASEAMWVSSIWRRVGGGWINIFSQDTPAA
nr:nuclear transport factor 2 family protein [uncultured Jannaschia sp.]